METMKYFKWAAFKWFVRDSALTGTAVLHCFNTLNCSTSITNQPSKRPWNRQGSEAVYVLMALWWLYGGYVFQVVGKPEIFAF